MVLSRKIRISPVLVFLGMLSFGSNPVFASENIETTYYDNGQVECQTPYRDGKKEGTKTCFYKTGVRKTETVYENDIERLFTWFAPDGLPLMSTEYDSGHHIVQTRTWYASGEMKNVTPYKNGVRHGLFREYRKDGTIRSEILYENDVAVEQ